MKWSNEFIVPVSLCLDLLEELRVLEQIVFLSCQVDLVRLDTKFDEDFVEGFLLLHSEHLLLELFFLYCDQLHALHLFSFQQQQVLFCFLLAKLKLFLALERVDLKIRELLHLHHSFDLLGVSLIFVEIH